MIALVAAAAMVFALPTWDAASRSWRTAAWSANVELRVESAEGPARRVAASWEPDAERATLRMSGLSVWAEPGRLIAWNPLHAGAVFEVVEPDATAGELLGEHFPPLMLPPLSIATGGDGLLVGRGVGLSWIEAPAGEGAGVASDGVLVSARLINGTPWIAEASVRLISDVVYNLRFSKGDGPVSLPHDLDDRRRVALAELAGRAGDVEVGDRMPIVRLGVVSPDATSRAVWSINSAFGVAGRTPAALILFAAGLDDADADFGFDVARETRRELARRSVWKGRPAEDFPGVIARPVFVVEPTEYDAEALTAAAAAWSAMPRQPGFDEAAAATPNALWGPRSELIDRVAPFADRAIVVVSTDGRLRAVLPMEGAVAGIAAGLADVIAPDLMRDIP